MRRIVLGLGIFVALILSFILNDSRIVHATDVSSPSYQVIGPVITSGGGYSSSGSFSLLGVISELVHDVTSSSSFISNPGFAAYPFSSTPVVSVTSGDTTAGISWTAAMGILGYASSYSVGQSTISGGPYSFTPVGSALSYSASGLTDGTTYYFVVQAFDQDSVIMSTSSEVSVIPSAPYVPPAPPTIIGGGSSGGGGYTPVINGATVNFTGRAYPRSTITLLQDARVMSSTAADANATFQMSLTNVSAGNYIYSVYSEDSAGNRSSLLSFPVSVTGGAVTNIGGIFISPIIDVDKSQVKKGDNIAIFGQSAPKSVITITVNSSVELFLQAKSDIAGAYLYNLDTSPLEIGSHAAKSKAATSTEISDFGQTVGFAVGTKNVAKTKTKNASGAGGDINSDGHINIVDFSIEAYWYNRPLSGSGLNADLNHDGKVDLKDLSILASHWTG